MNPVVRILLQTILVVLFAAISFAGNYAWHAEKQYQPTIVTELTPPSGYTREPEPAGSFAEWLRYLPVKNRWTAVKLYNGLPKINQLAHVRVIDIDVDKYDLQQCADAVMRLRAEYLWASGQKERIRFNFTSGDPCVYKEWRNGIRPEISGNNVKWKQKADPDSTYKSFRNYLLKVFTYAGSASLSRELKPVPDRNTLKIGDVFIQGGYPGHAVIVVDLAINRQTGEKLFLLAQSYMPAQQIHILKNPNDSTLSPWYQIENGTELITPEWDFLWSDLKRFMPN